MKDESAALLEVKLFCEKVAEEFGRLDLFVQHEIIKSIPHVFNVSEHTGWTKTKDGDPEPGKQYFVRTLSIYNSEIKKGTNILMKKSSGWYIPNTLELASDEVSITHWMEINAPTD